MSNVFSKYKLFGFLTVSVFLIISSQGMAQEKRPVKFELEADPLPYFLNGYSIHAAVTYGKFRSSVGVFAIDQPSFSLNNDAFSVRASGYDVKTDYLFNGVKGWHAGLQLSYNKDEIGLKNEKDTEDHSGIIIGARGGYRFMFGKRENNYKGFYLNPWIALMYMPDVVTVNRGAQQYKQPHFYPFPAIHVGWRF